METETQDTMDELFQTSQIETQKGMKILPDLKNNIKCGNSLIGKDFLSDNLMIDNEEVKRVNPFDWNDEFAEIMKDGGFDVVIGNPPWGQKAVGFSKSEKEYLLVYPASSIGISDLSRYFIEKSIDLLKANAYWGQVLPDIILLKNYDSTRKLLLDSLEISNISDWGQAFYQVNIGCCTIVGCKVNSIDKKHRIYISIYDKNEKLMENILHQNIFQENIGYKFNLYLTSEKIKIIKKLDLNDKFQDYFDSHEGIHSGNIRDKLFVPQKENEHCRKLILGGDEVKRYCLKWNKLWVNYYSDIVNKNKKEYAGLGKAEYFETTKLVIRRTGDFILANVDKDNYYFSNNVFVSIPKEKNIDVKFFLGLLNSTLLTWYYRVIQPRKGKLFAELKLNVLNIFPIPKLDFSVSDIKNRYNKIVEIVDMMLEIHKQLHSAKTESDKKIYQQKADIIDEQIDKLVYELYGLMEEEIKIVEGIK
jgi:hypothetical protein